MDKITTILFGMFLMLCGIAVFPLFSEILFFAIASTVLLLAGFVIALYGFFFFGRNN